MIRNEQTASEVVKLKLELRRARLQAAFLDQVGLPRHLPTRLTMVLLRRPEYRAALEGFLEFRRSTTVRLEEPALDAPLTELPRLYETWGLLRVISTLVNVGAAAGYQLTHERLLYRDATGVFVQLFRDGRPAIVLRNRSLERTVRLIPQRNYSRSGQELHSASYDQKPDITVEITDDNGTVQLLLFDPKYKLDSEETEGEITDARPKKTDIDKMHAYRDAIRNNDDERVVQLAAIMYAGPTPLPFGTGIEAISAVPGSAATLDQRLEHLLSAALSADSGLTRDAA